MLSSSSEGQYTIQSLMTVGGMGTRIDDDDNTEDLEDLGLGKVGAGQVLV